MRRVAIAGGGLQLQEVVVRALQGFAEVLPVEFGAGGQTLADHEPFDSILVTAALPLELGIGWLDRCKTWNRSIPVILLAGREDASWFVELLGLGVDDCVPVTHVATQLRSTIERAIERHSNRISATSFLVPPEGGANGETPAENRRGCYRVKPPATVPARILGEDKVGELELTVLDFSIGAPGRRGGILLSAPEAVALQLPADWWAEEVSIRLRLDLPDELPSLTLVADLVPGTRRTDRGSLYFAAQYTVEEPAALARLESFWAACQRN